MLFFGLEADVLYVCDNLNYVQNYTEFSGCYAIPCSIFLILVLQNVT